MHNQQNDADPNQDFASQHHPGVRCIPATQNEYQADECGPAPDGR
jgi:hypothetical protein